MTSTEIKASYKEEMEKYQVLTASSILGTKRRATLQWHDENDGGKARFMNLKRANRSRTSEGLGDVICP